MNYLPPPPLVISSISSFLEEKNMNELVISSILAAVLPYLLINHVAAIRTDQQQQGCSPSSCGRLTNISYPFRLKGDPPECGDRNYELLCDGNTTILSLLSGKYYVEEISYDNSTARLVDASVASGSCRLPSLSFSQDEFDYSHNLWFDRSYGYATFLNCTKSLSLQEILDGFRPTHCLSSGNNSIVYVLEGDRADYNSDSCSYITMIPMGIDLISPDQDIFDAMRLGFLVSWAHDRRPSRAEVFRKCWRDSARFETDRPRFLTRRNRLLKVLLPFIPLQIDFLDCLNEVSRGGYDLFTGRGYNHSQLTFRLAIILVVLLDIAALRIIITIIGRFVIAPVSILVFLAYKSWEMLAPIDIIEKFLQSQSLLAPKRYSYIDIVSMTNHFKEKLGQGGFGSVFKGKIPGGPPVAVKILGNSKCNGDDFISEVSTIGMIHHVNIVHLVGFCSEGANRALIYEFMPNGSLDRYIFSKGTVHQFTPEKLHEIALGVAQGINYLHQGCDMRILHFDIKPHNILLDHKFTPKVSDFGLAKLYPKDHSLVSMGAARGTIGYIAPELINRSFGVISHKSDVYSFGMLLLEMAGRRRNADPRADQSSQVYYPSWIYDKLNQNEGIEISDAFEIDKLERKLCIVGLSCIQTRSTDRPSMSKVIEMLEADVDTLQMPPKPFLFSSQSVSIKQSCLESSTTELSIISECE